MKYVSLFVSIALIGFMIWYLFFKMPDDMKNNPEEKQEDEMD